VAPVSARREWPEEPAAMTPLQEFLEAHAALHRAAFEILDEHELDVLLDIEATRLAAWIHGRARWVA
jgi:hypothetical protein